MKEINLKYMIGRIKSLVILFSLPLAAFGATVDECI